MKNNIWLKALISILILLGTAVGTIAFNHESHPSKVETCLENMDSKIDKILGFVSQH